VGSEFRRRSVRTWLACAGGNPVVALAGKLAPLFVIFFFMMLAVPLILEGLLEISFKGNVPMMMVAASLLIVGYLALGALLQLLVGDLATGLGLTGLVVSPAFGYAGVGFPVFGMNAFAQLWSAFLPLRWYSCSGRRHADCRCTTPRAPSLRWRGSPCSTPCSPSSACAPSARG
jgi:ABC-2 type transport system permease protein